MGPRIAWKPSAYDFDRASSRLRAYLPVEYLGAAGWDAHLLPPDGGGTWDCVVFQKSYSPADVALAESLKARGARIVADLCDNHLYRPASASAADDRRAEGMQAMVDLADCVTVSTPTLAAHLAPRATVLVDDALDRPLVDGGPRRRWPRLSGGRETFSLGRARKLRLLWFGNSGSDDPPFGLVTLGAILPELAELSSALPLRLTVVSDSRDGFERHVEGRGVDAVFRRWSRRSFAAEAGAHDVCVIPVELNPLTVCKSNNRALTALMLGVPVVASPIPSYQELGEFVLFEDWAANVTRYAGDPELARSHVEAARSHIRSTWTPERVVAQWGAALELALGAAP